MASKLNEITLSVQQENQHVYDMMAHALKLNANVSIQFEHLSAFNQDQILLQTVKADHITWRTRLTTMVMTGEIIPDSELVDHTQCRLGQWYYGKGQSLYGQSDTFRQMEPPHARIHDIGKEIASLVTQGQIAAASQKIVEIEQYSQQLFDFIDQLSSEADST